MFRGSGHVPDIRHCEFKGALRKTVYSQTNWTVKSIRTSMNYTELFKVNAIIWPQGLLKYKNMSLQGHRSCSHAVEMKSMRYLSYMFCLCVVFADPSRSLCRPHMDNTCVFPSLHLHNTTLMSPSISFPFFLPSFPFGIIINSERLIFYLCLQALSAERKCWVPFPAQSSLTAFIMLTTQDGGIMD